MQQPSQSPTPGASPQSGQQMMPGMMQPNMMQPGMMQPGMQPGMMQPGMMQQMTPQMYQMQMMQMQMQMQQMQQHFMMQQRAGQQPNQSPQPMMNPMMQYNPMRMGQFNPMMMQQGQQMPNMQAMQQPNQAMPNMQQPNQAMNPQMQQPNQSANQPMSQPMNPAMNPSMQSPNSSPNSMNFNPMTGMMMPNPMMNNPMMGQSPMHMQNMMQMNGGLPPLQPDHLPPIISPTTSTSSLPSPAELPEHDAFAALDAERASSPSAGLPELPGAPLKLKTSPAPVPVADKKQASNDNEFGDFARASPSPAATVPSLTVQTVSPTPVAQFQNMQYQPQQPQFAQMHPQMHSQMHPQMPQMHPQFGNMPPAQMQMMQAHFAQQQAGGMHPAGMMPQQMPQQMFAQNMSNPMFNQPHQHPQQFVQQTPTPAPSADDDDFGDFSSAPSSSAPAMPAVNTNQSINQSNNDAADDFGDFESAPQTEAQSVEVDDDDFGDFSAPAAAQSTQPTPVAQPTAPVKQDVESLLSNAFAKAFDHNRANAPLVDQPAPVAMAQRQPVQTKAAPVIPHHKGRDLPADLDDLLVSIMPEARVQDAPLPALPMMPQHAQVDDDDFGDFSSMAPAAAPSASTAAVTVEDDDDDFADFTSAPPATQVEQPVTLQRAAPPARPISEIPVQTPDTKQDQPKKKKKSKDAKAPVNAEETAIAAAIKQAKKSKSGTASFSLAAGVVAHSNAFAIAPPPAVEAPAAIAVSLSPPIVAPTYASPSPVTEEDDFDADFDAPTGATPFGIGPVGPSNSAAGLASESPTPTVAAPQSNTQRITPQPSLDFFDELMGSSSNSSTSAPALPDLFMSSQPAPSPVPAAVTAISNAQANPAAPAVFGQTFSGFDEEEDDFADFESAPAVAAQSPPSISVVATPVVITKPAASPSPPLDSSAEVATSPRSVKVASFDSIPSFPRIHIDIPRPIAGTAPSDPESSLPFLRQQERFEDVIVMQQYLDSMSDLPSLQAAYKEAIAASMDDEDELPKAMAIQAKIKKLKAAQPPAGWNVPAAADPSLGLTYTQIISLLTAIKPDALSAFASAFPTPFADIATSRSLEEAQRTKQRANSKLRSLIGLLPHDLTKAAQRCDAALSLIDKQMTAGVIFVDQISSMETGQKASAKVLQSLTTSSSFFTGLSSLYIVYTRLQTASHIYGIECNQQLSQSISKAWQSMNKSMNEQPVWKLHRNVRVKGDKDAKRVGLPDVDVNAIRSNCAVPGSGIVPLCELCLTRCEPSSLAREEGREQNSQTEQQWHGFCSNVHSKLKNI